MIEALRPVVDDLLSVLADIAEIASDESAFIVAMGDLGWEVSAIPQPIRDLSSATNQVVDILTAEDFDDAEVLKLLEVVARSIAAIQSLKTASHPPGFPQAGAESTYWGSIGRELLDAAISDYLTAVRPTLAATLRLAGFIRETPIAAAAPRLDYLKREIRWAEIGRLIFNPKAGFSEAFDWSGTARVDQILSASATLLEGTGLYPGARAIDGDIETFLNAGAAPGDEDDFAYDLRWGPEILAAEPEFGVLVAARPAAGARKAGIAFLPYAKVARTDEIELTEGLVLTLKGDADFTKGMAVTVAPESPVLFDRGFIGGGAVPPAEALVGLKFVPGEDREVRILGDAESSSLSVKSIAITAGAKSSNKGSIEALVEARLDNARLVIKPGPNEADSFIAKLLPKDGLSATFSLSVVYSSVSGFHLGGSGSLEATFPSRVQLGPVELQSVTLALRPEAPAIVFSAGATLAGNLGPLQAVVENVGLKLTAAFPDPPNGNLGPANLVFGFKPPNGLGVSLDLAVIKGGGYLRFDELKGEYSGALEFSLADFISVKALGIVTTKLPDGSPGFSLLLVLTAEFNPGIQLSFGFTLSGVGGIVGLNRSMSSEALLAGVKTGAVSSVMFPPDVIANAPRIISDLAAFFPARPNTFLIGPMLKIGWGTPTLLSVSMGVVIEIPGNVAILGTMEMALPAEDAPLMQIKVAFAGGIDFDGKRIFFVAALYDSRILAMTLEGGMGFYIAYGDDPVFVLTVGGFHPRFVPPALPFPAPNRLSLSLWSTAISRIRIEAYFALTSNTAQFGAKAQLFFGLSECEVSGQVSFDALMQFDPFYVIVEVSGSVSLKVFGMGLFSIRLHFTLEGLTPWRARGEGSISFFFFDVSANFDITWGDAATAIEHLVHVFDLALKEMEKPANWRQVLPPSLHILVTLRSITAGDRELIVHPMGTLEFSQRAVPLEKLLDKVGEQKPADVKSLSVRPKQAELSKLGDTREPFAPAQFEKLDAAAKLSRKSYEPMVSGLSLGWKDVPFKARKLVKRRVRYEEEIIDSNYRRSGSRFTIGVSHLFDFFLRGSSVALSSLSQQQKAKFDPFEEKVQVVQDSYVVAKLDDNLPYAEAATFASEAEAHDHLKSLAAGERSNLHVVASWELAA
jgi:Family of unknown function (DUF6603)